MSLAWPVTGMLTSSYTAASEPQTALYSARLEDLLSLATTVTVTCTT